MIDQGRYYEDVQQFFATAYAMSSMDCLTEAYAGTIRKYGFDHFACCVHVDFRCLPKNAVCATNYPVEWRRHFMQQRYERDDPIVLHTNTSRLPFAWHEIKPVSPRHGRIFNEASEFGLRRGYSVPIHSFDSPPASCTVVEGPDRIDPDCLQAVHLISTYFFEQAERIVRCPGPRPRPALLSPREREVLEYAGQGKTSWEIGQVLGISENTVNRHFEQACKRLGVTSRTQAVVRALFTGQIGFGDVLRYPEMLAHFDRESGRA